MISRLFQMIFGYRREYLVCVSKKKVIGVSGLENLKVLLRMGLADATHVTLARNLLFPFVKNFNRYNVSRMCWKSMAKSIVQMCNSSYCILL